MKKTKRISRPLLIGIACVFAAVVVALVILVLLPNPPEKKHTVKATGLVEGDWVYTLYEDDTTVITAYRGTAASPVIPVKLGGKPVISIGEEDAEEGVFSGNEHLTSVTVPGEIPAVGAEAFAYCKNLVSLTLEEGVKTLGEGAVMFCSSLTTLSLPKSLTDIGDSAFNLCTALTEVTLPDGVKTVGGSAFFRCRALEKVTFPDSVESVGERAFDGCEGLTEVVLAGVKEVGANAFASCTALQSVTLGDSVSRIGKQAFADCPALVRVTLGLGDSLHIAEAAFRGAAFTSFTIPKGTTRISYTAFAGCTALAEVEFLGRDCGVDFGEDASKAEDPDSSLSLFTDCTALTSITFGREVTRIPAYLLRGTAIREVAIPESVRTIGAFAFAGTALEKVRIPVGLTTIQPAAFRDCASLAEVEYQARDCMFLWDDTLGVPFSGCPKLVKVTVADSVERLPDYFMYGIAALTDLTLPDGIKGAGKGALWGTGWLDNQAETAVIVGDTLLAYRGTDTVYTLPDAVRAVGMKAFYANNTLQKVVFPNELERIDDSAFEDCTALTEVTWPEKLGELGASAFAGAGLVHLVLPEGVTELPDNAFAGCTALESVSFPAGLEKVGAYAFYGCTALKKVTLPDAVTEIGAYAFAGGAEQILVGQAVTSFGEGCFGTVMGQTGKASLFFRGGMITLRNVEGGEALLSLPGLQVYTYSEKEPAEKGNYWHFGEDDGIEIWK